MSFTFKKATRVGSKLRVAIDGPSGSGKTYTALRLAFGLIDAGLATRIVVIDTEHGSASKYAGLAPDGKPWDFETCDLKEFSPTAYADVIVAAQRAGFDCIVLDSLSHAWTGAGGALDIVDRKSGGGGNSFTAWRDVTPLHNHMVDTIIQANAHVIGTIRVKTDYVLEPRPGDGKMVPRKVGLAPIQRAGLEYEFDVYASMDLSHQIHISKTRCSELDEKSTVKPTARFWGPLMEWARGGGNPAPASPPAPAGPHKLIGVAADLAIPLGRAQTLEELATAWFACQQARKDNRIASADMISLATLKDERKQAIMATPPAEAPAPSPLPLTTEAREQLAAAVRGSTPAPEQPELPSRPGYSAATVEEAVYVGGAKHFMALVTRKGSNWETAAVELQDRHGGPLPANWSEVSETARLEVVRLLLAMPDAQTAAA